MIADTPQIEEPMASSEVSFGVSLKALPSQVISTMEMESSSTTAIRLMPPSLSTSPSRKRTPEQHDAELEEELVGRDAGLEDFRHADRVGDDQTDDDRPEHVFDVRQREVIGLAVSRDGLLDQLAGEADGKEQREARQQVDEAAREGEARFVRGDCDRHASPRNAREDTRDDEEDEEHRGGNRPGIE